MNREDEESRVSHEVPVGRVGRDKSRDVKYSGIHRRYSGWHGRTLHRGQRVYGQSDLALSVADTGFAVNRCA